MARPSMQVINNIFLHLALQGRGYNNCCDPKISGELFLIKTIAKNNPKLCIDVGANKGLYSKNLLEWTGADVIAFEPLRGPYTTLNKLKDLYGNRLHAYNFGIGAKDESLDLYYSEEATELASFSPEVNGVDYVGKHNVNKIQVEVITLDRFYESFLKERYNKLDLLKIDTEGFEYEVILGAKTLIDKLKPNFIQIEFNWHQLFRNKTLKSFQDLLPDYELAQLLPHESGMVRRDANKPEVNIFHYSNFVFIRKQ
jgi:FkbM family methyltransferase